MEQDIETFAPLAPEEENTGDTNEGVYEHDEKRVKRAPEAEGDERGHGEAYNQADDQSKGADS